MAWNHGLQVWRIFDRSQPLDRSRVRESKGADRSIRPGLRRGPFDGVVAIVSFLLVGNEFPFGGIAATHVLYHDRVASFSGMNKSFVFLLCIVLSVGSPIDQDRESFVTRRKEQIRPQFDSIPHGNDDVPGGRVLSRKVRTIPARRYRWYGKQHKREGYPETHHRTAIVNGREAKAQIGWLRINSGFQFQLNRG